MSNERNGDFSLNDNTGRGLRTQLNFALSDISTMNSGTTAELDAQSRTPGFLFLNLDTNIVYVCDNSAIPVYKQLFDINAQQWLGSVTPSELPGDLVIDSGKLFLEKDGSPIGDGISKLDIYNNSNAQAAVNISADDNTLSFRDSGGILRTWTPDSSATGGQANVQSDWDSTDTMGDSYIKNKPTITQTKIDKLDAIEANAEMNVQSDWNETTTTDDAYIKNKPSISGTPTYADNTAYNVGDEVTHSGSVWRVLIAIPSTNTTDPVENTNWSEVQTKKLGLATARDGVNVSHSGNTLTYTAADDTIKEYTPTALGYTDEEARDALAISDNGTTLTYTDANDATQTFTPTIGTVPAYANSTAYSTGDLVTSNNTQWRALTAIPSSNTTAPTEGTSKWSEITVATQTPSDLTINGSTLKLEVNGVPVGDGVTVSTLDYTDGEARGAVNISIAGSNESLTFVDANNVVKTWTPDVGDGEANVQADWSETTIGADAFIKNKPNIPTEFTGALARDAVAISNTTTTLTYTDNTDTVRTWSPPGLDRPGNVQSDWNVTTNTSDAFIKNKPEIPSGGIPNYQNNTAYSKGTIVKSTDNKVWKVLSAVTTSNTTAPTEGSTWSEVATVSQNFTSADARDALAISDDGSTLTYTDASDVVQTWTPSGGSGIPNYATLTAYSIGALVVHSDTQWRALVAISDTNETVPAENSSWSEISTLSQGSSGSGIPTYATLTAYSIGAIVNNGDTQWRAIAAIDATNTTAPIEGTGKWSQIATISQVPNDLNVSGTTLQLRHGTTVVDSVTIPATYTNAAARDAVSISATGNELTFTDDTDTVRTWSPTGTGTGENNVQADYTESDNMSDAYIKNKPNITGLSRDAVNISATANELTFTDSSDTVRTWSPTGTGTGENNVQADFTETDNMSDTYIKNKPTITQTKVNKLDAIQANAEVNVQADWNATNTSSDAYIANKPSLSGTPPYATLTAYSIGSIVAFNNTEWRALQAVLVTNTTSPVEGPIWSEIATVSQSSRAAYSDGVAYSIGDVVTYNNTEWRALQAVAVTNITNPSEGAVWSQLATRSQVGGAANDSLNLVVSGNVLTFTGADDTRKTFTPTGTYTNANARDALSMSHTSTSLSYYDSADELKTFNPSGAVYTDAAARDALAIADSGNTLTYTGADDTVHTWSPTGTNSFDAAAARDALAISDDGSTLTYADNTDTTKTFTPTGTFTEAKARDAVDISASGSVLTFTDKEDVVKTWTPSGTGELNVQANWTETTTTADSYIQNKPSIPSQYTDTLAVTATDISDDGDTLTYTDKSGVVQTYDPTGGSFVAADARDAVAISDNGTTTLTYTDNTDTVKTFTPTGTFTDAKARDAVAISATTGTLTYTGADDVERTFTPPGTFTEASARDALAIADSGNTLTYTGNDDTVKTWVPTGTYTDGTAQAAINLSDNGTTLTYVDSAGATQTFSPGSGGGGSTYTDADARTAISISDDGETLTYTDNSGDVQTFTPVRQAVRYAEFVLNQNEDGTTPVATPLNVVGFTSNSHALDGTALPWRGTIDYASTDAPTVAETYHWEELAKQGIEGKFRIHAYRRSTTDLTGITPTNGGYNPITGIVTAPGTGYSNTVPGGTTPLWHTYSTVDPGDYVLGKNTIESTLTNGVAASGTLTPAVAEVNKIINSGITGSDAVSGDIKEEGFFDVSGSIDAGVSNVFRDTATLRFDTGARQYYETQLSGYTFPAGGTSRDSQLSGTTGFNLAAITAGTTILIFGTDDTATNVHNRVCFSGGSLVYYSNGKATDDAALAAEVADALMNLAITGEGTTTIPDIVASSTATKTVSRDIDIAVVNDIIRFTHRTSSLYSSVTLTNSGDSTTTLTTVARSLSTPQVYEFDEVNTLDTTKSFWELALSGFTFPVSGTQYSRLYASPAYGVGLQVGNDTTVYLYIGMSNSTSYRLNQLTATNGYVYYYSSAATTEAELASLAVTALNALAINGTGTTTLADRTVSNSNTHQVSRCMDYSNPVAGTIKGIFRTDAPAIALYPTTSVANSGATSTFSYSTAPRIVPPRKGFYNVTLSGNTFPAESTLNDTNISGTGNGFRIGTGNSNSVDIGVTTEVTYRKDQVTSDGAKMYFYSSTATTEAELASQAANAFQALGLYAPYAGFENTTTVPNLLVVNSTTYAVSRVGSFSSDEATFKFEAAADRTSVSIAILNSGTTSSILSQGTYVSKYLNSGAYLQITNAPPLAPLFDGSTFRYMTYYHYSDPKPFWSINGVLQSTNYSRPLWVGIVPSTDTTYRTDEVTTSGSQVYVYLSPNGINSMQDMYEKITFLINSMPTVDSGDTATIKSYTRSNTTSTYTISRNIGVHYVDNYFYIYSLTAGERFTGSRSYNGFSVTEVTVNAITAALKGYTASDIANSIVAQGYPGVTLTRDDTFDLTNNALAAGNARIKYTYDGFGNKATLNLTDDVIIRKIKPIAAVSIPQTAVVTEGSNGGTEEETIITVSGVGGDAVEQTTFTITLDSTHASGPITGTFSVAPNAATMLAEMKAKVDAEATGVVTTIVGSTLEINSTLVGPRTNASASFSGGNNSTAMISISVATHGTAGDIANPKKDTLTISNVDTTNGHTNAVYSTSLANSITETALREAILTGISSVGGYSTDTSTADTIIATSTTFGNETNMAINIVRGAGSTATVTNTVTTEGADAISNSLTGYTIAIDDSISEADLTGFIVTLADKDTQDTQLLSVLNNLDGVTAVISNNQIYAYFTNSGETVPTTVTYTTGGLSQTATSPAVTTEVAGTHTTATISDWADPYREGGTTVATFEVNGSDVAIADQVFYLGEIIRFKLEAYMFFGTATLTTTTSSPLPTAGGDWKKLT